MAGKVERGESFTLEDFLEQMAAVKKMGSLSKLLGMLPGMGELKDQIANLDDREMDRVAAIIHSMTPQERRDPKILNASRRQRIAGGSGRTVTDINQLIERFEQAQKMMKQMRSGAGMPGMPGMPGMGAAGGAGRKSKGKQVKSNRGAKGRSGNPAKRAQQAVQQAGPEDQAALELPPEFKNLLG
jgi:signal recognition particle subunit SRP54